MVTGKGKRLIQVAKDLNVGVNHVQDYLDAKGHGSVRPNEKIGADVIEVLQKKFSKDSDLKKRSEQLNLKVNRNKETVIIKDGVHDVKKPVEKSAEKTVKKTEAAPAKVEIVSPLDKVKENSIKVKKVGKIEDFVTKSPAKPVVAEKVEKPVSEKVVKPAAEKVVEPAVEKVVEPAVEKVVKPAAEKVEVAKKEVVEKVAKEVKVEDTKPKVEADKPEVKVEKASDNIEKIAKPKVIKKINLETTNSSKKPVKSKENKSTAEKKTVKNILNNNEPKIPTVMKVESVEAKPVVEKTAAAPVAASSEAGAKDEIFTVKRDTIARPKVLGKIELPVIKPKSTDKPKSDDRPNRRKRKRISTNKVDVKAESKNITSNRGGAGAANKNRPNRKPGTATAGGPGKPGDGRKPRPNNNSNNNQKPNNRRKKVVREGVTEEAVQKQIKDTLARLTSKGGKSKGSKYRKEKRAAVKESLVQDELKAAEETKVIKVTEFVSVNELASMMDVTATQVIGSCMGLGLFVSINQRLDAETMSLVADEFGYTVDFISVEVQEAIAEEEDREEDLVDRAPIVTVMGHVDHGKTSLLDYVRKANVIAGEAGGITQHIGAYNVALDSGKRITFLDTPGHEAFTAMRARGAQVTDIAIIIVAADDDVMPQTIEAINHASAAGVPIVFAINKCDRPSADPERIKAALANMNFMVEDWGGKYQSQEISAKEGTGVEDLLEKVLLEAEMLNLKANPEKRAVGTIVESSLDKGRGYVSTILVQSGTLSQGDVVLAGPYFGHVKAMFNERNQRVKSVGPSEPVLVLGLSGAPQAGDKFNVMESEKDARQTANKREQLQREQGLRVNKHITLDEIGRRIAIGNFQELNVVVKGDVDGSIEALSDSLIKLSTDEIAVNVIHKAVGQISESDVMLASASNAIIIGFQVRPSLGARKLAEAEEIDVRLYSIIYDAIDEIKAAMEGMLSPEIKEEVTSTIEVREVFKITKVGTIAGCFVKDGKVKRGSKIRLIRDGIVVYTGMLGSLKRFKDDVKEVSRGYECGLNIANYNDIKELDIIESYEEVEVDRKL